MKSLLALALLMLPTLPLQAAETAWQEVSSNVRLRLVSTDQRDAAGATLVGLEIDMPANTRTYWRVPGETGIPTQIDIAGSSGLAEPMIEWPFPAIDVRDGYTDFVYWGPTLLPIALKATDAAPALTLTVVLGVCSDICIPAQARFELPLTFAKPDRTNSLRIRQALALTPMEWDGATGAVGNVSFDPAKNAIAVQVNDPSIDSASIIATSQSGEQLFGAPQKSPVSGLILLPVLGTNGENNLENQPVQLTFMTSMGAYWLARTVTTEADH